MNNATMKLIGLSALLLATFSAGSALAGDAVLAGKSGMTLYTFDKDDAKSGKSSCLDDCAGSWPPTPIEEAPSTGKEFGQIERPDGFKQLTIDGKPLYFFAGDQKPGQTTGDNVGKVWHVVQTAPKATHSGKCGSSY